MRTQQQLLYVHLVSSRYDLRLRPVRRDLLGDVEGAQAQPPSFPGRRTQKGVQQLLQVYMKRMCSRESAR
jgi:hypothetical protein